MTGTAREPRREIPRRFDGQLVIVVDPGLCAICGRWLSVGGEALQLADAPVQVHVGCSESGVAAPRGL